MNKRIPRHSTIAIALSHAILEDQIQARIKDAPPTNADAIYPAHLCDPRPAILAQLERECAHAEQNADEIAAAAQGFEP